MSADDDQLRRDVQYLKDRLEIHDCITRYARGVDRHDAGLITDCYHEDGASRYGSAVIAGHEHGEWSNEVHAGRFRLHAHHITNHTCEIDGDVAYCETYNIAVFLSHDQKRTSYVSARYLDQLERRDGAWRILRRRALTDIAAEGDASFLGAFRGTPVDPKDFWTREDLSYQRPIDLDAPAPGWH